MLVPTQCEVSVKILFQAATFLTGDGERVLYLNCTNSVSTLLCDLHVHAMPLWVRAMMID